MLTGTRYAPPGTVSRDIYGERLAAQARTISMFVTAIAASIIHMTQFVTIYCADQGACIRSPHRQRKRQ